VSLLRSYLADDEVEEVEAVARRHDLGPGTPSSETWTDAVLRFSSGVTASVGYVSTWTSALRWGRPRIASVEGTAGYLVTSDAANRLHRLEGSAQRDYGVESETRSDDGTDALLGICYGCAPSVRVENPFAGRVRADAAPDTVADGLARAAELTSLHAAITEGILPEYGITAARRSQEIGIAIAESARLGKPLSTRLGAETGWERERNAV